MGTAFWLSIIICYALAMIGIGLVLRRQANESYSTFGLASNRFGSWVITLVSVGAWVGGGGLIGLSTWCYSGGLSEYWTYAMAYIGMFPWIFIFVKRIKVLNLYTVPDLLCMRYSKYKEVVRYPSAFLYIIRNATLLAMQLNALAFLFTSFFGWGHAQGVFVGGLIVVLYTITSGYLSVMVTNFIQSIFQTIAPILALAIILWSIGGYSQVQIHYEAIGRAADVDIFGGLGGGFVKLFLYEFFTVGLFYFIGDQFDYQRIGAAKNTKVARKSLIIGLCIATPFLLLPSLVGVSAALFLPEGFNANLLFYEVTKAVPPWAAIILLVGILSTIMSATSSYLFGGAMNVSHDIMAHHARRKGITLPDKTLINYSRIGIVIACAIGMLFAIFVQGIIAVWLVGLAICTSGLFVPFMGAWFSKKINTEAAVASMITGMITGFVWWIMGNPLGFHAIWAGIAVSLVTCIIVCFFTPPPSKEEVERTYYFGEKFKNIDGKLEEMEKKQV